MLNCFYWYSIIWSFILFLYSFKLTRFNDSLDFGLLLFILFTILISFMIGYLNRNKFKYSTKAINPGNKPIIIISVLFVANFIYAKSVPLLSVISGTSVYGDFESIPYIYVILNGISFYYGINYFNAFLNINKNKKRNIISFVIINIFYLLAFSRSTILFLLAGAFILFIMSKRNSKPIHKYSVDKKKKKKKYILLILMFVYISLYLFGALGNVRSGYKYNDNTYIERIGLYNKYPSILPKQFMWTYSYLTSPLANLNYNVSVNKYNSFNGRGVISELINRTLTIRLFPDIKYGEEAVKEIGIYRDYFNAGTGYFLMFTYGGFVGMIIEYFVLIFVSYLELIMAKHSYNEGKENCTYVILLMANSLMFFYNSLNTTVISWWLIINFIALLKKPKIKKGMIKC